MAIFDERSGLRWIADSLGVGTRVIYLLGTSPEPVEQRSLR